MPALIVVSGQQAGKHFELANRPLAIGRDPSRDIQILDPKVSRKHAIIRRGEDGFVISATKALNGIVINGDPADGDVILTDGATITLGDTELRYTEHSDPNKTNAIHQRKAADRAVRDAKTTM